MRTLFNLYNKIVVIVDFDLNFVFLKIGDTEAWYILKTSEKEINSLNIFLLCSSKRIFLLGIVIYCKKLESNLFF